MAKKRKTREQKLAADSRHNFEHKMVINSFQAKLTPNKNVATTVLKSENLYPFLVKDLTKTFALTATIIAAQIVLFLTLKLHLIKIPGLSY